MRRLLLLTPLALAAAAGPAQAAELVTDRTCYLQRDGATSGPAVGITGTGFTPDRPYSVALDGAPLPGGTGRTDDSGAMTGRFAPALGPDELERRFAVAVTSEGVTAAAEFALTRFRADFAPSSGNPARLRVRFSVHGFGLMPGLSPEQPVWLHYIAPDGRRRATVRLGRTSGACGSIARTSRRPLFPFRARRGTWKLQFDTSQKFRRGTSSSRFLFYTINVRIRKGTR